MITLIVNSDTSAKAYTFNKSPVIIGAAQNEEIDLSLPDEQLENIHIKIFEQDQQFFAVNYANDPFSTINGVPFGKKNLTTGDTLEIGRTKISFQGTLEKSPVPPVLDIADTAIELPLLLDKIRAEKDRAKGQPSLQTPPAQALGNEASQESLLDLSADLSISELDLEEEMRQLDAWFEKSFHPITELSNPVLSQEEIQEIISFEETPDKKFPLETPALNLGPEPLASQQRPSKASIKDLYFKDAEDEPLTDTKYTQKQEERSIPMDWHTVWIFIVGVVSTLIIIALLLYANASGKSEDNEIKAAEGIADVAMALAHAHLNNIVPQNQNWSDPDFLKNNLTAVLSSEYPLLAHLDSHGQFINNEYLLRIYTSSDLSQFLVIAQPSPSLLQWLIPRSTILLYSEDMKLHKTLDLKSLNRLLVNPILDSSIITEIANLVNKTELITLSSISKKQKNLGFSPPKALALIRPGAENRVYNAPRYYNFGESIMLKALALSTSQENDNEIAMLKQELDTLNRYPNFVMYSSQGVKAAIEAQKALALFDPTANFLIAYLQYNSQGAVQGSHLLIDDSSGGEKEIAFHTTHFFPDAHTPYDRLNPEIMHPLFFQLSALLSGRQRVLGEIGNEITALIAQENQGKIIDFDKYFWQIKEKYITADREQLTTLYKKIVALNQDYSTMPMSEFMQYIKIAGLEPLFPFFMQNPTSSLGSLSTNFFPPSSLKQITESTDLEELESLLSAVHSHINLNALPDPKKLISLQHQLKSATLNKVDFFLFSPKIAIEAQFFSAENRQRLKNILKLAWVRDEDEINFYVSEFDSLCSEKLLEDQETDQVKEAEQTTPLITLSGPQAGWYQAPLWERFSPKKHHLISP